MLDFVRKLAIGSDHAGFLLKGTLIGKFTAEGYEFDDKGTFSVESVDYPDFALPVCRDIQAEKVTFGVLICGSGNGMSMAANKYKGIRAALCWTEEIARLARLHNDANILVLPARFITDEEAKKIFHIFMITSFEGGRHIGRIEKIDGLVT
ncbi:MAG: ribose 5-phosphate isomerase B [Bacteroidetes bacterium]|nr:ribose 5-phosphate isomerase B [Bacteroidota bacterium]